MECYNQNCRQGRDCPLRTEQRAYAERVAEAVRQACLKCFTNKSAPAAQAIKELHLPGIVAETSRAFLESP